MNHHTLIAALVAVVLPVALVAQEGGPSPNEIAADVLLGKMTLEQKIQQIGNQPNVSDLPTGLYRAEGGGLKECGFSFVGRSIPGIPDLDIPTIREINGGNGIRGGSCTPEPVMTAGPSMTLAAASFDPALVEGWGEVVGVESFAMASQVLLGPALNLIRTPYAGRAQEYPSEDPYLAGMMGAAQVRGIQSQGVQAQIKHFVGNEHEFQRERWTAGVRIPSRAMHELYLLPFEMAVKDGRAASIMCAFPYLNDTAYICDSQDVLVKTLRERWGFDGWIESDRRAMHSTVDALLAGVGWELDFQPKYYTAGKIMAAINNGDITEADIDAVLRPRYIKMYEFGQFADPFDTIINIDTDPSIDRAVNAQKARALAEGGITLLKNEGNLLPLGSNVQSIALIGHPWFAGSASIAPRNGDPKELATVVAPPEFTVTPQQGLEEFADNVAYNDGTDIAAAVELAENADVVILMVGSTPRESRDLLSLRLPDLCLFDKKPSYANLCTNAEEVYCPPGVPGLSENCVYQDDLVQAMVNAGYGNKTAVVLYSGAGILMDPWLDDVGALIAAWFPGQEDGAIMADILFGELNPSGKLPVTFPTSNSEAAFTTEAQYPGLREDTGQPGGPGFPGIDVGDWEDLNEDQLISNYTENLQMGYRWYEANGVTPVFPFGHGLSYTTFEYSNLRLNREFRREFTQMPILGLAGLPTNLVPNRTIPMLKGLVPVLTVEYTVTNTGAVAGAEATQVYLKLPRQAEQPSKRLVGFDKVYLEPGASARVSVQIDAGASNHPFSYFVPDNPNDLTKWADGEWASATGRYEVHVGGSSADTPLVGRIGMAFPRVGKPSNKFAPQLGEQIRNTVDERLAQAFTPIGNRFGIALPRFANQEN
ncbi:beta-glucosidase family protein [Oceanisphaera sp. IT1-181]|uniref:beta-glucosidase family protein n=1 Tax=Oceanisphaera sp. IT1-181 TaxID=3081199 RepID=UPI0029CA5A40|nr:glycoside hydrolase family 3 C-terminal domain-containing protein [Oceanisphaera sp. IT1-181]